MILTCPQCSTRYQADAAKFQPSGRTVRCAKCAHVWHQDAPPRESDAIEDVAAVVEAPPAPPPPRPSALAPNPVIAREVQTPARPKANWARGAALVLGWLGLIAIVLALGWSAVKFRQQIVALWPQSASLYARVGLSANASGIDIEDVTFRRSQENGQSVLAVAGILANTGTRELPVPQIRIGLIDDDRHELYHWIFTPGVMTLRPGQTTKFVTRLPNPPDGARHFELRFARTGE